MHNDVFGSSVYEPLTASIARSLAAFAVRHPPLPQPSVGQCKDAALVLGSTGEALRRRSSAKDARLTSGDALSNGGSNSSSKTAEPVRARAALARIGCSLFWPGRRPKQQETERAPSSGKSQQEPSFATGRKQHGSCDT